MTAYRKLVSLFLSLQLWFFSAIPAYGFDLTESLKTFANSASVENAAKKACIGSYNAELPFSDQYSNICPILRESELCKDVEQEDRLKCDSYEDENAIEILSFSFLKNCLWGLWNSLEDLVVFIKDAALATVGYIFNGETRSNAHEALGEYSEVLSNYIALEMDKALEETDSQAKAAMMVAGGLLSDAFNALMGIIEKTYYSLGCYHQAARQERLCNIMGDIIMPPIVAFKLIFGTLKFAKYAKRLPTDYKQRMDLAPKNAPVLQRRARELTPEEMKSPHIQKLADRMESTMRTKMGIGIAAPKFQKA